MSSMMEGGSSWNEPTMKARTACAGSDMVECCSSILDDNETGQITEREYR